MLVFEENEIEEKRQKVDLHKLPKSGFLLLLDFGGEKKREREKEGFAEREGRSACHREKIERADKQKLRETTKTEK